MKKDSYIEENVKKINEVSGCFCIAKWMQVTIDLVHGLTQSCHHPKRHLIPLDELKNNPSALHNTQFKKDQRLQMINGIRPPECGYCWKIEDTPGDHLSDRLIKSLDNWALPELENITGMPWNKNVIPTYVEVMFGKECNFACSYCVADISSSIFNEIKKHGPYSVLESYHRLPENERLAREPEKNPYIQAFWLWWPELITKLKVLRVTGGEPLLNSNTFKIFDELEKSKRPELTFAVNSNLGIPEAQFENFLIKCNSVLEKNNIKEFELFTSVDTFGEHAEFIRRGLDYKKWRHNLVRFFEVVPKAKVIIMCTFNIFSIPHYKLLLEDILLLKSKYPQLLLDISYLRDPTYLMADLAPDAFIKKVEACLIFMQQNEFKTGSTHGFLPHEINKLQRIYNWLSTKGEMQNKQERLHDFYSFVSEYSRRYSLDFREIFKDYDELFNTAEIEYNSFRGNFL